ncbi:hypothetical protein BC829DRAFT_429500 [Chytridium lagenaria]|nr:hypothetical protein BC829DRAFT_429500 [Chytridium lagenaria]
MKRTLPLLSKPSVDDAPKPIIQAASDIVLVDKRSCIYCRSRKRKCDGSLKKCQRIVQGKPISSGSASNSSSHDSVTTSTTTSGSRSNSATSLISAENAPYPLTPANLDPLVILLDKIAIADDTYFMDSLRRTGAPAEFGPLPHEDWLVVDKYCKTARGHHYEVFDRKYVLENLIDAPLAFRFAICSYACYFSKPRAPFHLARKYYLMAKKSHQWCIDHPSLISLQTALMLMMCAASFGDFQFMATLRNLSFRTAQLLKLDSSDLLSFLNEEKRPFTENEMTSRDLCWRSCVFLDNMTSFRVGIPQFFQYDNPVITTFNYFRFFSTADFSSGAALFHLSTLLTILNQTKAASKIKFDNLTDLETHLPQIRQIELILSNWFASIAPYFGNDPPKALLNELDGTHYPEWPKVKLLLGYYTGLCQVHFTRALLSVKFHGKYLDRSFKKIIQSAPYLLDAAERIIHLDKSIVDLDPFSAVCVFYTALVYCDVCIASADKALRIKLIDTLEMIMTFLKTSNLLWPMMDQFSPELRRRIEMLASLRWKEDEVESEQSSGGSSFGSQSPL